MNLIKWLEDWYLSQCDGNWEHGYGLKIGTLDNPGWYVSISLQYTYVENKQFEAVVLERNENDWIHCKLNEGSFEGFGGPSNLEEIITVFKNWVEFEFNYTENAVRWSRTFAYSVFMGKGNKVE